MILWQRWCPDWLGSNVDDGGDDLATGQRHQHVVEGWGDSDDDEEAAGARCCSLASRYEKSRGITSQGPLAREKE